MAKAESYRYAHRAGRVRWRRTRSTVSSVPARRRVSNRQGARPIRTTIHGAHELREAAFGGEELPVPVESIAEDLLGLAVEARELDVSGMLLPAERRILVNAAELEPRRRFTIAHELGHWICQCLEGTAKLVYCRAEEIGVDAEAKALEREANVFAANLVMPESAVRTAWTEGGGIEATARLFEVSSEAMHWRLYNCGFAGEPPRPTPTAP